MYSNLSFRVYYLKETPAQTIAGEIINETFFASLIFHF